MSSIFNRLYVGWPTKFWLHNQHMTSLSYIRRLLLVHVLVTMHRFVWIWDHWPMSISITLSQGGLAILELIDQYLNFTFCTGRVWDPWTGCELKSWLKERLSPAQDFPSLGQDNLTAFLRRLDTPDKLCRYLLIFESGVITVSAVRILNNQLPNIFSLYK